MSTHKMIRTMLPNIGKIFPVSFFFFLIKWQFNPPGLISPSSNKSYLAFNKQNPLFFVHYINRITLVYITDTKSRSTYLTIVKMLDTITWDSCNEFALMISIKTLINRFIMESSN